MKSQSILRLISEFSSVFFVLMLISINVISRQDLSLWDETHYMSNGIHLSENKQSIGWENSVSWESSGGFSAFYWLLSIFVSNNVELYFAGRILASTIFVLLIWFSIRINTSHWHSFSALLLLAVIPITYVWPGVSLIPAGLLVFATAIMKRWPSFWSGVISLNLCWLAASFRPELVWFSFFFTLVFIVFFLNRAFQRQLPIFKFVLGIASTFLLIIGLSFVFGNPFYSSNRSWVAFSQHFALRNPGNSKNSWLSADDVVTQYFGDSANFIDAVSYNPTAFFAHTFQNIIDVPADLIKLLGGSIFFENLPLFLAVVLFEVILFSRFIKYLISNRKTVFTKTPTLFQFLLSKPHIVFCSALIFFSFIPVILYYPRDHYFVFIVGIFIWTLFSIPSATFISTQLIRTYWFGTLVLLIAVTVSSFGQLFSNVITSNAVFARSISKLSEQDESLIALGINSRDLSVYLPNAHFIDYSNSSMNTFDTILTNNRVNIVFMDDIDSIKLGGNFDLASISSLLKDSGFVCFDQNCRIMVLEDIF